jgi:hypothetical protein
LRIVKDDLYKGKVQLHASLKEPIGDHGCAVNDALIAIAALGLLAGGAIVLIDSMILRRIRRQRTGKSDVESPSDTRRR